MRIWTYLLSGLVVAGSIWWQNLLVARTFIHAGHLIDPGNASVRQEVTLVIDQDRLAEVKSGFLKPAAGDQLVDLSKSWVLPGLMDMHTHLSFEYSKQAQLDRFTKNEADYAIQATLFAKRTLEAGFTTVRDLGDAYNVTVALRNAISKGTVDGPRIFTAAKSIATTGGHADPSNGMSADLRPEIGPKQGVINGPIEAREAVRQRYKDGADLIKITATAGVLSVAKSGDNPQFYDDELKAVIATARDYGMRVAAHAHGADGMKRAVLAGVDSIEHGTFMNDEIMSLMKRRGTYLVPTITAGQWVAEKAKIEGFFPRLVQPKAERIGPKILATVEKAWKEGVNIAFGTDTGVSQHGRNAQEFVYLVQAGLTPMEAIQSATVEAAKLLNASDYLGHIAPGFKADIVATDKNPLEQIEALQAISFVMKEGRIVKDLSSQSTPLSH